MLQLNINEIKTHLSATLRKVEQGETVVICKRNRPIARITPIKSEEKRKRPFGLAGKEFPDFKVGDEIFEPLPQDILDYFTGEKE